MQFKHALWAGVAAGVLAAIGAGVIAQTSTGIAGTGTSGGGSNPAGSTFATQYKASTTQLGGTGPGTSGDVLTSNGAGSAPTFQTPTVATTSGSFTATFTTGFTTNPTQDFNWTKTGGIVVLRATTSLAGTSNNTATNTASGSLPAAIRPSTTISIAGWNGTDNGASSSACLVLALNGTITWSRQTAYGQACNVAWTASGTKAIAVGSNQNAQVTYSTVN